MHDCSRKFETKAFYQSWSLWLTVFPVCLGVETASSLAAVMREQQASALPWRCPLRQQWGAGDRVEGKQEPACGWCTCFLSRLPFILSCFEPLHTESTQAHPPGLPLIRPIVAPECNSWFHSCLVASEQRVSLLATGGVMLRHDKMN